jgi:succinate dehydrogenase / fumarate reductase cytochrome b subunit
MAGNLLIFEGQPAINSYAEKLHSFGPLLWLVRLFLLAMLVLHVTFTMLLWKENKAARPTAYLVKKPRQSTMASRTMAVSGLIVLAFIIYHVLHFTVHATNPSYASMIEVQRSGESRPDVFRMVVDAFRNPLIAAAYIGALILAFFHLTHGIKSFLHTLGLSNRRLWPLYRKLAPIAAGIIVGGFIAVPVAVFLGVVKPSPSAGAAPSEIKASKDVAVR